MSLETAASGVEGVVDRDVGVVVIFVLARIAIDDDVVARDVEADPDVESRGAGAVVMRRLDDDLAPFDAVVDLFELAGGLGDVGAEGVAGVDAVESDLHRKSHDPKALH